MAFYASGQETILLSGIVTDTSGKPLSPADVTVPGTGIGTSTLPDGSYELRIQLSDSVHLFFSFIGFESKDIIKPVGNSKSLTISVSMKPVASKLEEVEVTGIRNRDDGFTKLNMKELRTMPTVSGSVESYLKTLPGVSSNNELSSQYSVRGGNFDENLIYINDIEVYRPYLIQSGKQEGLSIVNSNLASTVQFSAGGFNASYGDKMSSVLDIRYRKPTAFGGGFELSLLGGSLHLEGITKDQKFTWLTGIRFKTNQYLLKTLDVSGDYKPRFGDFQTYLTYRLTDKWQLDFLGNIAINQYNFIPEDRNTSFGTVTTAVQLYVLFNGHEIDQFNTYLGALTATYRPNEDLSLKFITSAYQTVEEETYDIEGLYSLNELDKEIGSENIGDSIMNIGVGRFVEHARNYFRANVIALNHRGSYHLDDNSMLQWGLKFQLENIDDQMNEWKMVDSAGYSTPYNGNTVNLASHIYANNNLNTSRVTSFILYSRNFKIKQSDLILDAGLRTSYWSFNKEFLVSPRISLSLDPNWEKDIIFRFSSGFYYQPPFYKEIKNLEGQINPDIRAQKSTHFVLGSIYNFRAWNRPFRLSTDLYYKNLNHLIPYKVDNVRIYYTAKNNAKGYSTGIEFRINGEFVKGVESWASLSLMQTREKLTDGSSENENPGYYPRPTDQLINFSLFFQDYFPNNPTFKVYMSLHYGSGLPTSPPENETNENFFRMPPYRRVDIGLSKVLKDENATIGDKGLFKNFKTAWVSLEIFNLLGINNTISYTWITTVNNMNGMVNQFAVPNYLTSRRINLKLTATF